MTAHLREDSVVYVRLDADECSRVCCCFIVGFFFPSGGRGRKCLSVKACFFSKCQRILFFFFVVFSFVGWPVDQSVPSIPSRCVGSFLEGGLRLAVFSRVWRAVLLIGCASCVLVPTASRCRRSVSSFHLFFYLVFPFSASCISSFAAIDRQSRPAGRPHRLGKSG